MSVEAGEIALASGSYAPTGDRLTDMVLSACAGLPFEGYAGEIEPTTPEFRWCHAVLSGGQLPDFDYVHASGYELTHFVMYATDFARQPRAIPAALAQVQSALLGTPDDDLLVELGLCLVALGQPCLQLIVELAEQYAGQQSHTGRVADILLARLG